MSSSNKKEIIAVLPTGEWAFVDAQCEVSFYAVGMDEAEKVLEGRSTISSMSLSELDADYVRVLWRNIQQRHRCRSSNTIIVGSG
jgi:hypothetical protein